MDTGSDVQSGEGPLTERVNGGMPEANLIDCSRPGGFGYSIDDIPDNKGKEKRPNGYWLPLRQRRSRLLPARAIQPYAFRPPELREEQMFEPSIGGEACIEPKGKGACDVVENSTVARLGAGWTKCPSPGAPSKVNNRE